MTAAYDLKAIPVTAAECHALALEQEGEAKAHIAMGDDFEARNALVRAAALRLTASIDREAIIDVLTSEDAEHRASYVQGYLYGLDHVVRDVALAGPQQELSRTTDRVVHERTLARLKAGFVADAILALRKAREALFRAAPSHQGGHSATGAAIAEVLDVPFPLNVYELEKAAKAEGYDPNDLWPWLADQRRKAAP